MAKYKHESGEEVHLVDGSFEDTRIGVLAEDGQGGWSKVDGPGELAGTDKRAEPVAVQKQSAAPPKPKPEG